MEQIPLTAQKRTILGRKVKALRQQGFIPGHVFGHKVPTIHVQVKTVDFTKVFTKAGETGIVDLAVDGSPSRAGPLRREASEAVQKRPVLIRNVQIHPVTDEPLHIDFYQVNLTEKVKVNVPLEITGVAPAVEKKIGLLLTPISEIEIEALPADIPDKIEIDVSKLANIGDEIKIKDLKVDRAKVTVHADEELVVVQVGELVTKEMEAVEAEIEAEQAEAVAETAAAQPEAPAAEAATTEPTEAAPEAEGEKKEKPAEEPKAQEQSKEK